MSLHNLVTVIIPVAQNETADDLHRTLTSLAPHELGVETHVLHDYPRADVIPFNYQYCKQIFSSMSIGPGRRRFSGSQCVKTPWVLTCDAHMEFKPGFLKEVIEIAVDAEPNQLFCFTTDSRNYRGQHLCNYSGAHFNFFRHADPDDHSPFGATLRASRQQDGDWQPVSLPLGGCYLWNQANYETLRGCAEHLGWGHEEPHTALKYWLSGGEIYCVPSLTVTHFNTADTYGNRTPKEVILANNIATVWSLFPDDMGKAFIDLWPMSRQTRQTAIDLIKNSTSRCANILRCQREIRDNFIFDIDWFCERFNILHPLKALDYLKR